MEGVQLPWGCCRRGYGYGGCCWCEVGLGEERWELEGLFEEMSIGQSFGTRTAIDQGKQVVVEIGRAHV